MALKRKSRVTDTYSMASMTDVIFLLLIFFLVTSTIIVPNTIKVTLPTSAPQSSPEHPEAYVSIQADETIPYKEVVAVINAASQSSLKVVLATRAETEQPATL